MENTPNDPKRQGNTTDWLYGQFIQRLRSGQWRPGDYIDSERELMSEFGVSRNALREALARLRALGLLDISHGRSTIITRPPTDLLNTLTPMMFPFSDQESFDNVIALRLALEPRAAYLAAQRRTERDIVRLEEILQRLLYAEDKELAICYEADPEFHIEIARATHFPLMATMVEVAVNFPVIMLYLGDQRDRACYELANHFHTSILTAIKKGQAERASVDMDAHIRASADRVMKFFRQQEAETMAASSKAHVQT